MPAWTDLGPTAVAHQALARSIANSPLMALQRMQVSGIQLSPRLAAQRAAVAGLRPPLVYEPGTARNGLGGPGRPAAGHGPAIQFNQVYAAPASEGQTGTLSDAGDTDYDNGTWLMFILDSELVYVRRTDRAAFLKEHSKAEEVPESVEDEPLPEEEYKKAGPEAKDEESEEDEPSSSKPKPIGKVLKGGAMDTSARISRLVLRGSWTSGEHQEVMCVLRDGGGDKCLRFSRNNAEDTAQWNALLSYQALTQLKAHDVDITVAEAMEVFEAVHANLPSYEQGDCHDFAGALLERLT